MNICGCYPILGPVEFPIQNSITENKGSEVVLPNVYENQSTICELKQKVVCDFYNILKKLKCGIQPDLEFLLEEIAEIYVGG